MKTTLHKLGVVTAGGLLIFPYIVVLLAVVWQGTFSSPTSLGSNMDWDELGWVLRNTFLQSFVSSGIAIVFGFLIGIGLVQLSGISAGAGRVLKLFCLLPSVLPSLFILLLALSLWSPFPFGLVGILLIHGFIYAGFVAVILSEIIIQQHSGYLQTAYVLGANTLLRLRLLIGLLGPTMLRMMFVIFMLCFASFAIPLTVGGGRGTTIEVLIYEKYRSGHLDASFSYALVQMLLLLGLSFLVRAPKRTKAGPEFIAPVFTLFLTLPLLGYLVVFLTAAVRSFADVGHYAEVWSSMSDLLGNTMWTAVLAALFVYVSFFAVALLNSFSLRAFLYGLVAPSMALCGLSVMYWQPQELSQQLFMYAFVFMIFALPSLFRAYFLPALSALDGQVEVALQMGAPMGLILHQILWPQLHKSACFAAGLVALWVSGDFALSRIIFSNEVVMAQHVYGLLNSFYLNLAMTAMIYSLGVGILIFFVFMGIGYVFGPRTYKTVQ